MGTELSKAVVDGILTGGVYALMAAGLTLIFGVMEIINIAQGIFVVLAAYLSYVLQVASRHRPVHRPAHHHAADVRASASLIEWGFIRRLKAQNRTALSILVTFAVAIVIEGILTQFFSADLKITQRLVRRQVGPRRSASTCPTSTCFGFALAVVLLAALYLFLYRTRSGKSIRASVQNRTGRRADRHRHQPGLDDHLRDRRRPSPPPAGWSSARPTRSTRTPGTT